jgi:hypothetical protein
VLTRKIPRETRDEALRPVGIGGEDLDDILHGDGVAVGMPAIEIGEEAPAQPEGAASPTWPLAHGDRRDCSSEVMWKSREAVLNQRNQHRRPSRAQESETPAVQRRRVPQLP